MPVASEEQIAKIGQQAAGLVKSGDRVGLGSGRAALAFVRALGQRVRSENLDILCVPTSLLTQRVAQESGVPLATLHELTQIDIAVDGADEVDPDLNLLKGGGGNLTREKVVASIAKRFVVVAGEEKLVPRLGTKFPVFVEVIEYARPVVTRRIEALGAVVFPRMTPDGKLFQTDNNNPYLHCTFEKSGGRGINDPAALERVLRTMPGVVETGLFIDMADEALIAKMDGSIAVIR